MKTVVLYLAGILAFLAPAPAGAQAATQFDFLVGNWSVDVTSKAPNAPPHYRGEWSARKTLSGLGIVDEYVVRDDSGTVVYSGTTLRAFDARSGHWTMRYIDQAGGGMLGWAELTGTKVGDEMHVEQRRTSTNGQTAILKIRYYNIQPNHFSWAADGSTDGGATWTRDFIRIEATRQRTLRP
jgi:hypothetical protein